MNYGLLLIVILIIGAIWTTALAMAIVLFYSNLKKYEAEKESAFESGYLKKLLLISILVPTIVTVAAILFLVFFNLVD